MPALCIPVDSKQFHPGMLVEYVGRDFMDKPIDNIVLQRRRRRNLMKIGLFLAALVTIFFLLSAWIRPSLSRNDIQTAVVTRGSIDATISATGLVLPNLEQAISSPGETRLLAVRKKPGETVKKGESILDLDRNQLSLLLERAKKDLALKSNQRAQLQLDMEKTLTGLTGQLKIKDLQLEYNESRTKQSLKLFDLGAISKEQLNQVKLDEQIGRIEKDDLEKSVENTEQSLQNQLDGITTELHTLMQENIDVTRQLDLLACKAQQDGVVTWVNDQIGGSIHIGEIIARVADVSTYRVEATISDIHATQLYVGMNAKIRINDLMLTGKVQTVYPAVENGIAKIGLSLDDAANKSLRPNLRADVYLVTSKRDSTMKVRKGPFVSATGNQDVFILSGNVAKRTSVTIGLMNFDEVEILSGSMPGAEIIISNMDDYKHLSEIKIH